MGPASLKLTWFAKLLWFAVDVNWFCPLKALADNTRGLLDRTALLAAGSTFGVIERDFLTAEDSRFVAIVWTVVTPSPDALLPDGSVWPWAIAGTAAAMRAIAAIDKLEIVLRVVIVLVSFF